MRRSKVIALWILSLTWGLPMTLLGILTAIVLHNYFKGIKNGCLHYELGDSWGGFSLGPIMVTCSNSIEYITTHEFGHSIQNCIYGPFMIFLVSLPSVIRYHYRNLTHKGATGYSDIWFEKQADIFGEKFK